MCVGLRFIPLLFPYSGGRTRALSPACKTNQVDFPDYVLFLPPNPMEKISLNTEALKIPRSLSLAWKC